MAEEYSIEYANGVTRIVCFKKPSFEQTKHIIDVIVEKYPYEKRLWDFSKIQFDFTMDEIKAISDYGKLRFVNPNRLAIIAPDDLAFGEMRVFQVHREQEQHSAAHVFRTEQEALDWLR